MKKYIGVKLIEAKPFTRGEHSISKGFDKVLEGKSEDEGYKVVYEDGYESWSPKDVFDKAYKPMDGLTFGLALESLKKGLKVSRKGWNGAKMWLKLIEGSFVNSKDVRDTSFVNKVGNLTIAPHVDLFSAQEEQIVGWKPSNLDMLSDDWFVVD